MEAPQQPCDNSIAGELLRAACRFDFFQAVRLAEQLSSGYPVGGDQLPEAVRFRVAPSLSYPSSSVVGLRRSDGRPGRPELDLEVAFMGLTGPGGVLPDHYSRLLIQQVRGKHFSLREFFDLFNH